MSDYAHRSLRLLLWYLKVKDLALLAFTLLRFLIYLYTLLRVAWTAFSRNVQDIVVVILLVASFALPILTTDYLYAEVPLLPLCVTAPVH